MMLLKILGYILMIILELVYAYIIIGVAKNVWTGIKEKSSFMIVWNSVVLILCFAVFVWLFHPHMLEDLFGWKV
ncbi:hypothetical protein SAMN05216383_101255 [Prevotella sp. KH2C16]|nr:hypothetical protein SAMN05216383_101255 [Prevotella sp. KH2C16]